MVGDDGLSSFGERLLAVIDEGRRISSYKLALLVPHGLFDFDYQARPG